MSAQPVHQSQRPPKTPAGIRAALPPEEQTRFEADFQTRMREAADAYDLAPVQDCLERWWPMAVIYAEDPAGYYEMMETVGKLQRGEYVQTVPWEETAARLGIDP